MRFCGLGYGAIFVFCLFGCGGGSDDSSGTTTPANDASADGSAGSSGGANDASSEQADGSNHPDSSAGGGSPDVVAPDSPVADVIPDSPTEGGKPDADKPAALGGGCWINSDCESPAVCWSPDDGPPGGYCVLEGCQEGSCPTGSTCIKFQSGETACLTSCTANGNECRESEGYACDTQVQVCWPGTGTVPPGGSCSDDSQCAGGDNAGCIKQAGFIGGYCIIASCNDDCPAGSVCAPVLKSGKKACVAGCGPDSSCREGYFCVTDDKSSWNKTCFPGCSDQSVCPGDFGCREEPSFEQMMCVDISQECSAANPNGDCPAGNVCDQGACKPFSCNDNVLEPNETLEAAVNFPGTSTPGLQICSGDHDWFKFAPVKADTVYEYGIDSNYASGDLALDWTDVKGNALGNAEIAPDSYHPEGSVGPTNLQFHSFVGAPGTAESWFHVFGLNGAQNNYGAVVREIAWKDGENCEALFSKQECRAQDSAGGHDPSQLIIFPNGNVSDPYVGDAVFFKNALQIAQGNMSPFTPSANQHARRELITIIRHAIHAVQEAFPGTTPLGIGDVGMADGSTPNGHPNGTHYYGANVDISYYIKPELQGANGNMTYRQICCDAQLSDWKCVDQDESSAGWGTCVAGSEKKHIVDLPRTALFLAKLAGSGRLRVVGVEAKIKAGLVTALQDLVTNTTITAAEQSAILNRMATADDDGSWVWHFNHIHASFCEDECSEDKSLAAPARGLWPDMPMKDQAGTARKFWIEQSGKFRRAKAVK